MRQTYRITIMIIVIFFIQKGFSQNVTVYLTSSGGSFTGEKWMNITTGVNGTGTVIWSQGAGIGVSDGLITDEAISIPCGITYYLNAYDQFGDSWDGSTYVLRDASGGGGSVIINNGGVSPDDGTNTDATAGWDQDVTEIETSESFSITCPCTPDIGSASTLTANCGIDGTFDVQITVNGPGSSGANVIVSDGGTNPNQTVSSYPTTLTFTGYTSGASVTLNADDGTCDIDANTVTHTCACTQPVIGVATVDAINCGATGTFDINLTITSAGMGTSVTISDGGTNPNQTVSTFPTTVTFSGYTAGNNVTLNAANFFCNVNANTVSESCVAGTSCSNAIGITTGYTNSGIVTSGTGGSEDWVVSADASCGTASSSGFEDSDVVLYEYTTGAAAGEAFYFTIEHDNSGDGDHQIGVWTSCAAGVLSGCIESNYNVLDDVIGVCAQSLLANTTYYIGVSKRNPGFQGADLNYDVIDFTVELSTTIPDDECASAPFLTSLANYNGSTRCNYTVSAGSPSVCGVSVDNDSWVSFVASDPFVSIDYTVTDCANGDGIQLNVFSGSCGSLSEIAGSCINPTGNNVSGNWNFGGLTPGDTYYIRADGYAGDLCNYSYDPIVGVLPVELISFSGAEVSSGYNRLEWVTASEINNDYFILEYSNDGLEFFSVEIVKGKGNSTSQNNYFTYHKPNSAKTFYRLKQVDFNGVSTVSKVIVILNENIAEPNITIYPNPTNTGNVTVYLNDAENVNTVVLSNTLGAVLKSFNIAEMDANRYDFNLKEFGTGLYFVTLISETNRITKKVIFNR